MHTEESALTPDVEDKGKGWKGGKGCLRCAITPLIIGYERGGDGLKWR